MCFKYVFLIFLIKRFKYIVKGKVSTLETYYQFIIDKLSKIIFYRNRNKLPRNKPRQFQHRRQAKWKQHQFYFMEQKKLRLEVSYLSTMVRVIGFDGIFNFFWKNMLQMVCGQKVSDVTRLYNLFVASHQFAY